MVGRLLHHALLATLPVCLFPFVCFAQASADRSAYPDRPLKLLVGYPPGSAADVAARIFGEGLATVLQQPIVVENKPGAASNAAAEAVAKTTGDGYTLFLGNIANVINVTLKKGSSIDLRRNMTAIALVCAVPNILVVNPSMKATTVSELIATAKAKPGQLHFGSSGHGTSLHLSGELFKSMADIDMVHVAYNGSAQALQDLIGGRLQVMFSPASTVLGQIEAGTVRPLGWTIASRGPSLPNLPTVAEAGLPGFETSIWFGINAPAGLPSPIQERLADAVARASKLETVVRNFRAQGIEPLSGGPAIYATYINDETSKWAGVAAKAGLIK